MNISFYDHRETFKLNDKMDISYTNKGNGVQFVEIRNFYKNPHLVRELALSIPTNTDYSMYKSAYTGYRNAISDALTAEYFELITKISAEKLDLHPNTELMMTANREAMFNLYNNSENTTNSLRNWLPHSDPNPVTGLVYLDDFKSTGTGLYKYKESGLHIDIKVEDHFYMASRHLNYGEEEYVGKMNQYLEWVKTEGEKYKDTQIGYGNSDFELIHYIESEFNKLVLFTPCILHSPVVDYKKLEDNVRVNQVMFLEHVKRDLEYADYQTH